MKANSGGMLVAVGRDLRQVSQLQQQLLDVQHSLERDYSRLHQAEIRYRMLFSMASEAMLFVDADSRKIVEANPAAGKLLGTPTNKLLNRAFPRGFSDNSNDAIEDLLTRVRAAGGADSIIVRSSGGHDTYRLNATLIRREDGPYYLIRLNSPEHAEEESVQQQVLDVVERSPDAFLVTDPEGRVLAVNKAFLDYCSVATELQVINQPIDQWLGRPGVDLNLLLRNLRDRSVVEHFLTTLYPQFGDPIDVELSAVSALDSDVPCFGFVLRRKVAGARPAAEGTDVLPRSLEEMTQLVGRVPLRDLVRETTDIIERLCIEAALKMTGDSRAAAAEMLGLSRQSLYVKLRRYGIGEDSESS
jgi:transcriptional regulator PpsR